MEHFIKTIGGVFVGMYNYFEAKIIPSIVLPMLIFMFGSDKLVIMKGLMFLVIIDFITGITSAYVSREVITSRIAVKSAFKIAIYGLLLSSAHLSEKVIPTGLFIETITSSFLALTEFVSIVENIGKMGYGIPKKLLNKLQALRDDQ